MKNSRLKAVLSLIVALFISANVQSKERLTYGLSLDIGANYLGNVERIKFDNPGWEFTQKPAINFGIGGFVRKPVGRNFSLESGVGYSFNRAKFNFIPSGSVRFLLHYIEVPVVVNYNIALKEKSAFVVAAGLKVKYLATIKEEWKEIALTAIGTGSDRDKFRSFNYAAIARVAYQFELNPKHKLELGLQLCQDLNKITTNKAKNWPYNSHFTGNLLKAKFTDFGIAIKYFL